MKQLNISSACKRVVACILLIVTTFFISLLAGCTLRISGPVPIPCGDTNNLINAINDANADPATHAIIELEAGCKYILDRAIDSPAGKVGLPSIISPIIIIGNSGSIVRDTSPGIEKFRLIFVESLGDLTLIDLTLAGGYAYDPVDPLDGRRNSGGAILNANQLTLKQVTIQNNNANAATGGIFNEGDLLIENSTITGSEQDANAFIMGAATAIYNYWGSTAVMIDSTIHRNGQIGIWNAITNSETASLYIENSTISDNGSTALNNDGDLEMFYSTIIGHSQGIHSVWYGVPTVKMTGNLFQNGYDCDLHAGVLVVNLFNMDSDGTCGFSYSVPAAAQLVGPLADNGGGTGTHALLPGSPAIDAVSAVSGPASRVCPIPQDQRGVSRPQNANCDIGAYEYEGVSLPAVSSETETPTPVPTPTDTLTPEPTTSRCDLFESDKARLVMFDIPSGTTELGIFVEWPHPLWGLEQPVPGDKDPWEYSATLGSTAAYRCTYQGYSGRIYCDFTLPKEALGTALPLYVYVNKCNRYIFHHPWVSVIDPDVPDKSSSKTETPTTCSVSLAAEACKSFGGTYDPKKEQCICPP